jgi:hypothetical protein
LIVGLMIGTVFYNVGNEAGQAMTNTSGLFFMLLFIFFGNAMPVILTCKYSKLVFILKTYWQCSLMVLQFHPKHVCFNENIPTIGIP